MAYCKLHRGYKAVRTPRGNCECCWYVYFACHVWHTRVLEYEVAKALEPERWPYHAADDD